MAPVWKKATPVLVERAPTTTTLIEAERFKDLSIDTQGMNGADAAWVEETIAALKAEGLTESLILKNVPLPEGLTEGEVAFYAPRPKSEKADAAPAVIGYSKVDAIDTLDCYGRGWLLLTSWLGDVLPFLHYLGVEAWFSNRADARFPVSELRLEAPPEAGWRGEEKEKARDRWNKRKKSETTTTTPTTATTEEPATF